MRPGAWQGERKGVGAPGGGVGVLQAVMLVRGAAVEALLTGLPLLSSCATLVLRGLPPPLVLGPGSGSP